MYPRSKFQEIMLEVREEMAREADFDVDLFIEMMRSGARSAPKTARHSLTEEEPAKQRKRPRPPR
jgi:hypothetical protein